MNDRVDEAPPTLRDALKNRPKSTAGAARAASPQPAAQAGEATAHAARSVGFISADRQFFKPREQDNNTWIAIAPEGSQPRDFASTQWVRDFGGDASAEPPSNDPWVYLAPQLTLLDDIRLIAYDSSWAADYVVVRKSHANVRCELVRVYQLRFDDEMPDLMPANHRIERARAGDPQTGWLIWRDDPKGIEAPVLLNAGQIHGDHETAYRWLLDHTTVRPAPSPATWK